jgi:dihydrodipicolinate synthase/N-acetylneuraminate lyase
MITGSIVAIVTPMHEDGSLDLDSYRALIDWHVASGTAAIVAVGTTGESPTVMRPVACRSSPAQAATPPARRSS